MIDANILVSELLRPRGRKLIANPEFQVYVSERAWEEATHELKKRVAAMVREGRISSSAGVVLLDTAQRAGEMLLTTAPETTYAHLEAEARKRVSIDPDDWPSVALALAIDAGIWTRDCDFLGCGCRTWTSESLLNVYGR